jgi:hypothetical protein
MFKLHILPPIRQICLSTMHLNFCNKRFLFLFLSLLFLSGCNENKASYENQWSLLDQEFNELLLLSDTATIADYEDFSVRIDRIQEIFADHQDPRGTFTTLYKHITFSVLHSMEEGIYEDAPFVGDFGVAFGKRYLVNLHDHLLNSPISYTWTNFYELCAEEVPFSRLVLSGMNAHITKDLLDALVFIEITPEKEADWILISDALLEGLDEFQAEFENDYEIDIDDLIALFGFGDLLDGIFGEDATIYTIINELRYLGYQDALKYLAGFEQEIEYKTKTQYRNQENIIQLADELGLLP